MIFYKRGQLASNPYPNPNPNPNSDWRSLVKILSTVEKSTKKKTVTIPHSFSYMYMYVTGNRRTTCDKEQCSFCCKPNPLPFDLRSNFKVSTNRRS